jgi:hypothetical protein
LLFGGVVVGIALLIVLRTTSRRRDRSREQAGGVLFAGRTTIHALTQLSDLPLTKDAVGSVRFPWWQAHARPLDMLTGELYLLAGTASGHAKRRSPPRPVTTYGWRWEPGAHARSVGATEFSVNGDSLASIEVESGRKRWGKVRLNVLPVGHIDLSVQECQRLVRALTNAPVLHPKTGDEPSPST